MVVSHLTVSLMPCRRQNAQEHFSKQGNESLDTNADYKVGAIITQTKQ